MHQYPGFSMLGYSYWVERNSPSEIPGAYSVSRFIVEDNGNPILTDALLKVYGGPDFHPEWGRSHDSAGSMINNNQLYLDGRVETIPVEEWELRWQTFNAEVWY